MHHVGRPDGQVSTITLHVPESDAMALPLRILSPRAGACAAMLLTLLVGAATATGSTLEDQLEGTRQDARRIRQQQGAVDRRQQQLLASVEEYDARIRELDAPLDDLTTQLDELQGEIAARHERITTLRRDYARQARAIARLDLEHRAAQDVLAERLAAAYRDGDPQALEVLAGSRSIDEMFERSDALERVMAGDRDVISRIRRTQRTMRLKRAGNFQRRARIGNEIDALDQDRAEIDRRRDEVSQRQSELRAVQADRDAALGQLATREAQLATSLVAAGRQVGALRTQIREREAAADQLVRGDVDGLDPVLLSRLGAVAQSLGQPVEVISGFRSRSEQQSLYSRFLSGLGNLAAPPGASRHESGRAADVYVGGTALQNVSGGAAAAQAAGLAFTVGGEPWHVEAV